VEKKFQKDKTTAMKIASEDIKSSKEQLSSDEEEWLGQGRRKRAVEKIMKLAQELLPMAYKKFACTVSYRTGLSLRKVTDDYLEVLTELGFLRRNDGVLELGSQEP
jgi:hypothetical protein